MNILTLPWINLLNGFLRRRLLRFQPLRTHYWPVMLNSESAPTFRLCNVPPNHQMNLICYACKILFDQRDQSFTIYGKNWDEIIEKCICSNSHWKWKEMVMWVIVMSLRTSSVNFSEHIIDQSCWIPNQHQHSDFVMYHLITKWTLLSMFVPMCQMVLVRKSEMWKVYRRRTQRHDNHSHDRNRNNLLLRKPLRRFIHGNVRMFIRCASTGPEFLVPIEETKQDGCNHSFEQKWIKAMYLHLKGISNVIYIYFPYFVARILY
jgi:hypothetical protein